MPYSKQNLLFSPGFKHDNYVEWNRSLPSASTCQRSYIDGWSNIILLSSALNSWGERGGSDQTRPLRWMLRVRDRDWRSAKRNSPVLVLFIICEGLKTLSKQLISCFLFYILCLNPGITVPKDSWDSTRRSPVGLGLKSKKLSRSSPIFSFLFRSWQLLWYFSEGWNVLSVREALRDKHQRFCNTQLRVSVPNTGAWDLQPEGLEVWGFLKLFLK